MLKCGEVRKWSGDSPTLDVFYPASMQGVSSPSATKDVADMEARCYFKPRSGGAHHETTDILEKVASFMLKTLRKGVPRGIAALLLEQMRCGKWEEVVGGMDMLVEMKTGPASEPFVFKTLERLLGSDFCIAKHDSLRITTLGLSHREVNDVKEDLKDSLKVAILACLWNMKLCRGNCEEERVEGECGGGGGDGEESSKQEGGGKRVVTDFDNPFTPVLSDSVEPDILASRVISNFLLQRGFVGKDAYPSVSLREGVVHIHLHTDEKEAGDKIPSQVFGFPVALTIGMPIIG